MRNRERERLTVTATDWSNAKQRLDEAETKYQTRRKEHREIASELKKLSRIRRVHGDIQQRRRLLAEIESLENVTELPEDAASRLDRAKREEHELKIRIDSLSPRLEEDTRTLSTIEYDEAMVERAEEVQNLNERRIAVLNEKEDLPNRQKELQTELSTLTRLAKEIGWSFVEPIELIERIPSRTDINLINTLVSQRGKVSAELINARDALHDSQITVRDLSTQLTRIGDPVDVSGLVAVLNAFRKIGDVESRSQRLQAQVTEVVDDIDAKIRSLRPTIPEGTDISILVIPYKRGGLIL